MSERFNVILDTPPDETWRGVIEKTDFKQVLKFFRLMALSDKEMSVEDKAAATIRLFFNRMPNPDIDLMKEISLFISCGEEAEKEESEGPRVFDYNVDHGRIFAAFWQTYGIDLRTASMHWWVFCEMLNALPEETKLVQYIQLRGKKPSKDDSPEYKKELRRMQAAISLEDENGDSGMDKLFNAWG